MKKIGSLLIFFLLGLQLSLGQDTEDILTWKEVAQLPDEKGLNGSFSGIHNDVMIIAGGANFPGTPAWEGGVKKWYDSIYVLERSGEAWNWIDQIELKLDRPLAYGASIATKDGLLCIGGDNSEGNYSEVFLLSWDPKERTLNKTDLESLPFPLSGMGIGRIDDLIYLVGGKKGANQPVSNTFLSFNLNAQLGRPQYSWKEHDGFPGEARIQPVVVGQSNGHQKCLYVFSGLHISPGKEDPFKMLSDVYEYDPHKNKWTEKNSVPSNDTPGIEGGYIAAAPSVAVGGSHILIFGGAGGEQQVLSKRSKLIGQIDRIKKDSSSVKNASAVIDSLQRLSSNLLQATEFTPTVWSYHTITDTWTPKGKMPFDSQVVTNAFYWKNDMVLAGGELKPGVRSNKVTVANLAPYEADFGMANYITLVAYLTIMVLMGWFFSRRNKTTDDFFLAGGRIPWWAAGLSIYATMLSAITYLSQPALTYSFDWQAYLGYFTILMVVPIVIIFYLPFYRKLKVTTAYEYLEKRFHVNVRIFASMSFALFQLVRMGVVVYLPALALSTVMGMDIYLAIIVMGILAILYTYLGGMEAVIWTDVVQVIVLLGGIIIGLIYISLDIGDVGYIFETAYNDGKFQMLDLRFSMTEVVTWSMFLGSFALSFVPYTTDQAVVQRYMTTSDIGEAKKSIWLNGLVAIPSGLLIFTMGTFLYVYFKEHPEFLNVGMQNDSVFPLFITNHLPPGVAGLLIAGIFSASMSSLDSSMHSVSTVATVDYYKRFSSDYTEEKGLKMAKWITLIVGTLGTMIACLMAAYPQQSLFFFFQEVIGLFGSAIAGVFVLGIFVKKANWRGTLLGALLSVVVLAFIKYQTPINFYIYPLIAIPVCIVGGMLFSLLLPTRQKDLTGLTYKFPKRK